MELTCFDRGIYLKRNKATYKFVNITPEQAVAQIAGEFGFEIGQAVAINIPFSRKFIGVSVYDILQTIYTLASRVTKKQYYIGFRADKLFITEKKQDKQTLVIQDGSNLIAANTTESIDGMVNAVEIYDKSDLLISTVEDKDAVKLYGLMREQLKHNGKDDKTSEAQKLIDDNSAKQKITVDCIGNISNITGGAVIIKEPYTGLEGLFYIDSDTHEWKRGQYYNKLVLNFENIMDQKESGADPAKK